MNNTIDFIVIGAQKAGTSWLYKRLLELPEFSMPPVKQLHYFDRAAEYDSPDKLTKTKLISRLFDLKWLVIANGYIFIALMKGRFSDVKWYLKWFYSNFNDTWYKSLFVGLKGLTGEVTPDYCILKDKNIARMRELAPNAKIIFILRNPLDRAWSHYRYDTRKIRNYDAERATVASMIAFMNSELQEERSDYLTTMQRFGEHYPSEQILVTFYDGIKNSPVKFLEDIIQFIGGDPASVEKNCKVMQRVNISKKIKMPEQVDALLKTKYEPMINTLAERFGGYCEQWKKDLNKVKSA